MCARIRSWKLRKSLSGLCNCLPLLNAIESAKVDIFWEGHNFFQNLHLRFVLWSNGQIYGGYFAKFCGLLRIYELYSTLTFSNLHSRRFDRKSSLVSASIFIYFLSSYYVHSKIWYKAIKLPSEAFLGGRSSPWRLLTQFGCYGVAKFRLVTIDSCALIHSFHKSELCYIITSNLKNSKYQNGPRR